jgi:hypothetical protein
MDTDRFHALTRFLADSRSRRAALPALLGSSLTLVGLREAATKKKRSKKEKKKKRKSRAILCLRDGQHCKKEGERCKRQFCLKPPFTIEASWESDKQDHDAIFFVPNEPGRPPVSFPYIDYGCLAGDTNQGTLYPFAYSSGDVNAGPGAETTTVQRWLAGTYEFWVRVHGPAADGDVTVQLRNAGGKVLRTWTSPPNPPGGNTLLSWHVFDLDGVAQSVIGVDQALDDDGSFDGIHPNATFICPA